MQEEEQPPKEKERTSEIGEVFPIAGEEDAASAAKEPTSERIKEISRNVGTLNILCNDNLMAIAKFLSLEDLCNLSRTSKYLRALFYDDGMSHVFLTIYLREKQDPLHWLARRNKLSILRQLLINIRNSYHPHVNINRKDLSARTPLGIIQRRYPNTFHETEKGKLLIEFGSYITIKPTQKEKDIVNKVDALESIKKRILATQEQFPNNGIIVDLSSFFLREIPVNFHENLANVVELDLSVNRLTQEAIKHICKFTNLQTIDLSWNHLKWLPTEIKYLTNLQILHLYNNRLTQTAVQNICQLPNLQTLDLRSNQLIELPTEIENLTHLQTLELDYNQLTELPIEIRYLTNLQTLILSNNQLTELPTEIRNLTHLQTLNLWDNQLTQLAIQNICQLSNLQTINLSWNQLIELPAEITELRKLQTIELYGNQLNQIAIQLTKQLKARGIKIYI